MPSWPRPQILARNGGLARAVRRVRRRGRRQLSARRTRARIRGSLPQSGYAWVTHRQVPVAARVDPQLVLGHQHVVFRDRLGQGLASRGIEHWWLPQVEGGDRILCLRVSARPAFLAAVAALSTPSWYVDVVSAAGRDQQRYAPGSRADVTPALARARGLRVWEYVAPDTAGGTFLADQAQGVLVSFWEVDDQDERRLVSLVTNLTATGLPAEQCAGLGGVPPAFAHPPVAVVGFPIDVVYTWVDGTDPAWLHQKALAAGVVDEALFTERANDEARFADHDELRYSLRALEQFAPWVHHVWIVTADQHPAWLRPDDPWVSVVSHRDLWPDAHGLPTFNSHAIEACLHRIPGLAEHFLYLNDDMFLGRPLPAERFFHANGIGKFFSSRALVDFDPTSPGEIASSSAAKNARRLLEERFGVVLTRKFFHTAAALTVSGMRQLEEEFPEVFAETRRAVFRTLADVAAAGSLFLNYGYCTGRLVPGRIRYTYIDPAAPDAPARLERLLRRRDFDTFCLNDGSTAETVAERQRTDALIRDFLARFLPVRGSFEV